MAKAPRAAPSAWAQPPVVGRCGRCGRGFTSLPGPGPWFDNYRELGKFTGPVCGGELVKLDPPELNV